MHYTITNHGNRHFEIFDERGTSLGTLDYKAWWPNKAQITTISDLQYDIAPTGFWQTQIAIVKSDMMIAEIKPTWGMGLSLTFANQAHSYVFKKKVFWNNDYVLLDESGNEVARVYAEFQWRTWNFHYEIDVQPNILDKEINFMLPFLLIYSSRYMRMRHAAVT